MSIMKRMVRLVFTPQVAAILILIFAVQVRSEPWMGTRFAQNCVACHSPGRVNLPAPDRRCTVSCQGCHVSPNGGGLRNLYGKWNQERWLSSWRPGGWILAKDKPAPLLEQAYERGRLSESLKSETDRAKTVRQLQAHGSPMKSGPQQPDESGFNRRNAAYEKIIETDHDRFMMTVPEGDPLRESQKATVIGGGDIRYFNYSRKTTSETKQYSVPMMADIGVQVKPIKRVSAVIESRFLNEPTAANDKSQWDDMFTSTPLVKSAYVLVDDLPFNGWVSTGIQRPLFGNYNPDQKNLRNSITFGVNQSVRATYKTTSLGIAPDVPFLNLHYLSPISNSAYSQDKGYAANFGARFYNYGASFMVSYWDTSSSSASELRRKMLSVTGSGTYGRFIAVVDFNRVQRETPSGAFDSGAVYGVETKYRFWRENYFVANYYWANVAADLGWGNSIQLEYGIKTFPIAGLEVELLASDLRNNTELGEANEQRLQGQAHFFF